MAASTFAYLHGRFNQRRRKLLVRAVLERIVVHDRAIVDVTLNPPFSYFLEKQLATLFDHPPAARTHKDIFEQLVAFMISPYESIGRMVDQIANGADQELSIMRDAHRPDKPVSMR